MSRLPPAPLDGPDADADAVDRLRELRGANISLLYRTLLHSGDVAVGWCGLGTAVRYHSSLDDRLRELIICAVARLTGAGFEWYHHAPLALAAGVTDEELDSLPDGSGATTFSARERVGLAVTAAVVRGDVDDALFDAAREHCDDRQLVELVATAAYYLAVSRFLQACDVRPPPEGEPPFRTASR